MVHNNLVGGWATPMKNDGVSSSVGMIFTIFHSQYDGKVIQNSMVPVTKQMGISWESGATKMPPDATISVMLRRNLGPQDFLVGFNPPSATGRIRWYHMKGGKIEQQKAMTAMIPKALQRHDAGILLRLIEKLGAHVNKLVDHLQMPGHAKTTYSTVLPPGLRSRSTPEFGKVLSRSTEGTPPFFKSGGLHSIQILDPCSRLHSFHFKNIQFQEPNPDLRNKPRSIFDRFYFDHVFFPKALSEIGSVDWGSHWAPSPLCWPAPDAGPWGNQQRCRKGSEKWPVFFVVAIIGKMNEHDW